MQTIQKRKQWALIAFTMIATLTLQLFAPITAHAEETSAERSIALTQSLRLNTNYEDGKYSFYFTATYSVVGSGTFVMRSHRVNKATHDDCEYVGFGSYLFSNEPFTVTYTSFNASLGGDYSGAVSGSTEYNGVYYCGLYGVTTSVFNNEVKMDGYANFRTVDGDIDHDAKYYIDNGLVDLSKDSYKELVFDESTATYDVDLDFASLGAKSNSAWTVSKSDDGYTLTTPSAAGVNIYWTNKQYVENSYVKIYFNGKYYKKFLDVKYVDGAISLSGEGASSSVEYDKIDRSSNSIFFLYNDILSDCIEQNNYDGGYSFVIDNIQLQCYAEIDGVMKKSRVYKIDFDLLRENGTTDTVFNDASNVTYSTTDSVLGDFTTAYDDLEFVADIDADKPIYEYDEVETNSFIKFFKWFYEMLQGISNSLGQFPQLLTNVFGFLPKEVIYNISLSLGAVVILRFLGR